jgi:hypothetical protein
MLVIAGMYKIIQIKEGGRIQMFIGDTAWEAEV